VDSKELQKKFKNGEVIEFDTPTIILGSSSPRRSRLFKENNIPHVQIPSTVDDTELNHLHPHKDVSKKQVIAYAKNMALAKLKPFIGKVVNGAVITMDTTAYLEGRILEKPITPECCREQHLFISGKTNIAYTAYAIYCNGKTVCRVMASKVKIKKLPEDIITACCSDPETLDAAGYRNLGPIFPYVKIRESHRANVTGVHIPFVLKMLKAVGFNQL